MDKAQWIAAAGAVLLAGCATPTAPEAETAMTTAASEREITAAGPLGPLAGTLRTPANADAPVVLIVPGSGPTDRNGNNPLGVTSASYRLLAEALADHGIASARIDKRGMFGSAGAVADANAATIGGYAEDVASWVEMLRTETGRDCIWVAGHSEGGIVALESAALEGVCGILLIASPGRPFDVLIREQLSANPANAPVMDDANAALDALKAGQRVDVADMHPALAQGLFNPAVQDFLIDVMQRDPAAMIAGVDRPVLIVSALADLQVAAEDARVMAAARPDARLVAIEGMTHVLKRIEGEGIAANMATYNTPEQPVDPRLVDAIAWFVLTNGEA